MMKINSLLNAPPSSNILPPYSSLNRSSPPETPDLASQVSTVASTVASTPSPLTPRPTSSTKSKPAKDAAVFERRDPKEPVNYPPFECIDDNGVLNRADRQELVEKHKQFNLFSGNEGLIRKYTRHIPYNSEKKAFGKTGREGFERESI